MNRARTQRGYVSTSRCLQLNCYGKVSISLEKSRESVKIKEIPLERLA
jgi:hypothetical protein